MRVLRGRSGTSLLEALIALTLSGIISAAVVALFAPTNRLSEHVATTGAVQGSARSAVGTFASALRHATRGGIRLATGDSVVFRAPLAMGVFCANSDGHLTAYFALNGATLDAARVEGYALRDVSGTWSFTAESGTFLVSAAGSGRHRCVAAGGGQAGADSDYYDWQINASIARGTGVLFWETQRFSFGPSALEPDKRALRMYRDGRMVELAYGFDASSHLEYRLSGSDAWVTSVPSNLLPGVQEIRLVGRVPDPDGGGGLSLVREVPLRNSE